MQDGPQNGSYSASEAAAVLDLSKRRVLQMLKRGELAGERDEAGRWTIPAPQVEALRERRERERRKRPTPPPEHGEAPLVEALKEQVEDLRKRLDREQEANRENRRIIAGLMNRIPELPAPQDHSTPSEPRESPESATEGAGKGRVPQDRETASERPWWRRIFGE